MSKHDEVQITKKHWAQMRSHADRVHPEECVGLFECLPTHSGKGFRITHIFPCRNVARAKKWAGQISKPEMRELKKVMRRGAKEGYVYGMYHSHPITGTTTLSEIDQASGRQFKISKLQIVLGAKNPKRVKRSFWELRNKEWLQHEIVTTKNVKRQKNS